MLRPFASYVGIDNFVVKVVVFEPLLNDFVMIRRGAL